MIPNGERRLLQSLSASRGFHELSIRYKTNWPTCSKCLQLIRIDSEVAYQMFIHADLWWDGKATTPTILRQVLLGEELFIERDSKTMFRRPSEYGLCPFREWCRRELGKTGIVLADIDVGLRRYGDRFGLDADGDAMLIEKKERWPDATYPNRGM